MGKIPINACPSWTVKQAKLLLSLAVVATKEQRDIYHF